MDISVQVSGSANDLQASGAVLLLDRRMLLGLRAQERRFRPRRSSRAVDPEAYVSFLCWTLGQELTRPKLALEQAVLPVSFAPYALGMVKLRVPGSVCEQLCAQRRVLDGAR